MKGKVQEQKKRQVNADVYVNDLSLPYKPRAIFTSKTKNINKNCLDNIYKHNTNLTETLFFFKLIFTIFLKKRRENQRGRERNTREQAHVSQFFILINK